MTERGGHRPQVALGEVDDAVRPVDQRDAERDQGDAAAEQRAVDDDA